MKLSKLGRAFVRNLDAITKVISVAACVFMAIMASVVIVNVFGRFLLGMPLLGTIELVESMMVIVAFFSIVYTQSQRGHVHVDLVLSRFRSRIQAILISIGFFLSLVLYAFITYEGSVIAWSFARDLSQRSYLLYIPYAPLKFLMVVGCFLFSLRLLVDIFRPLSPEKWTEGGVSK